MQSSTGCRTVLGRRGISPPVFCSSTRSTGISSRKPAHHQHSDYWNACVNKLLELLDGAVKSEGVIVVGATNRPGEIDEAIKRSGRLETHIEIPRPDIPALAGILTHHLGDDLDVIAETAVTRTGTETGTEPREGEAQ